MASREEDKKVAQKKSVVAGAALAASVGLGIAVAPVLGLVGLVPTAYLAYDWVRFRIKRGIRF